jgi:hypothetical protein
MTKRFPGWTALMVAAAVPMWLLAVPASGQAKGGSGGSSGGTSSSGGQTSSAGASSGGSHASGGGGSSSGGGHASGGGGASHGGGGGGHVSSGSGGGGGRVSSGGAGRVSSGGSGRVSSGGGTSSAVPRGGAQRGEGSTGATAREGGRIGSGGNAATPRGTDPATGNTSVPPYARPRDGQPVVGQAVPRSSLPPATGGTVVLVPGSYGGDYPWGFAGLGFAGYYGGYYGGGYDPDFGPDPYYPQYQSNGHDDSGGLKLKVKPSEATVYVDGYYVGLVDDFNGVFQKLTMEPGAHRVEIRAPGYETLQIDVRIEPGKTSTYRGELKKLQN